MTSVENDSDGDYGAEPEPDNSLRNFGEMTKAFRKRAGLTQEQLAPRIRYSVQYVGSVEQGRRFPSDRYIERVEEALDAFGVIRLAARQATRQRGLASWFRKWALLEEDSVALNTYECRVIPGLLQTEAYARALIANVPPVKTHQQVEAKVRARLERQRLLVREPFTAFSFILDQPLIDRQTGSRDITLEQIDHLLMAAELPSVELQLIPTVQPDHAGTDGPIQLLETADHTWLAYSEGQRSGQLISDPKEISILHQRYAKLRSQALNPADSVSLLKRLRGTL
ncbi:helix-turn-helix transcriptional regulator [Streptomyces sp. NPDC051211]|uniref:helix-turn-helix domain-containing protein n=1 Tax=Streptomyces sp. NPDC051211 TaxID=3154643 RepID=UPI00344EBF6B